MKIKLAYTLALFALPVLANTPPEITNVRASQRTDTKLVDIYYDAVDADGDLLKVRIEISDNDGVRYSVPAFSLTGDIGEGIAAGKDKHIVWDAGTDWDGEYSDKMRVKVYAIDAQGFPGLEWGNEVPPGGFLMGQDGGAEGSGPSRHVNIPWSYWLSKYEITAGQYCDFLNSALVSGKISREATIGYSNYSGGAFSVAGTLTGVEPAYQLMIVGDNSSIRWNVNKFEVVGSNSNFPVQVTFAGALAFACFYGYDLPTDAEWEKAARGPDYDDQDEHRLFPWGDAIDGSCAAISGVTMPVGYYNGNQIPIGLDMVNGYGLYDVVGNVAEWTRTSAYYGTVETYESQESLKVDRNRYFGSNYKIVKGGGCNTGVSSCYIYTRSEYQDIRSDVGFRVVRRVGVPE